MSWIWPDEPPAEPLPYYAVGVCDECWRPAEELVEGLGECCRCAGCGSPDAPIEHHGHRLCLVCARCAGCGVLDAPIEHHGHRLCLVCAREWEAAE